MAEEKATGAPALDTNIETGGFDEKRGQDAPPTNAPKAPVAEDQEPDEDMDALIEDLESE
ncbi:plasma membrane ATPase, partial [Fusarium coicis]